MTLALDLSGLTEKQAAFVTAYVLAGETSASQAALAAGYKNGHTGYDVLTSPAVQRVLHDYRERLIKTEGAQLAYAAMIRILKPGGAPPSVQVQAAKYMLDAAGHGAKDDPHRSKDLHEMTADELQEAIEKMDGLINAKAEAAKPIEVKQNTSESATAAR